MAFELEEKDKNSGLKMTFAIEEKDKTTGLKTIREERFKKSQDAKRVIGIFHTQKVLYNEHKNKEFNVVKISEQRSKRMRA